MVPLADLFANDGMHYLTKRPDEILTSIALAAVRLAGAARTGSFGAAARSTFPSRRPRLSPRRLDGARVVDARIVLGAVASRPLEADRAAALLKGGSADRRR